MILESAIAKQEHFQLIQATIDSLAAHIAILQNDGTIVAVNKAWKSFSNENNGKNTNYGIGLNYIRMSAPLGFDEAAIAQAQGDEYYSILAAKAITHVASEKSDFEQITYPCHAPYEQRWFLLTVTPLVLNEQRYVITSHENVTLLKQKEESISAALEGTVKALSDMSEIRDPYTAGHQNNVAILALKLAQLMNLPREQQKATELAASIHDIGKIAVPAEILTRPGRLSQLEYQMIKSHSQIGHDIIEAIPFPWPLAEIVLQHHERIDGSGYPHGLRKDQTHIEARVIMIADVLDAMISHRPYRPGLGAQAAYTELKNGSGKYYDMRVVDACFQDTFFETLKTVYPQIELPSF